MSRATNARSDQRSPTNQARRLAWADETLDHETPRRRGLVSVVANVRGVVKRIRVLVCDDSPEIRALLRELLRGHERVEIVGDASDGREAVRLARELSPDVVLMDVAMPVLDGIAATRQLRECCPGVRVIAFTGSDSPEAVMGMMEAGASDYCMKGAPLWELERAILHAGGPLVRLAATLARAGGGANAAELVVRELAELLDNSSIAVYLADGEAALRLAAWTGRAFRQGGPVPPAAELAFRRLLLVRAGGENATEVGNTRPDATGMLAAPLVADGEPLGVLVVEVEGCLATERDAQLAIEAADLAAAALKSERRLARSFVEARRDLLTGLPNRRAFDEYLEQQLAEVERLGARVGLAVLDLDGFKEVNDSEGHLVGDAVLREVARVLQRTLRADEEVFRIGGDEFAVVIVGGAEAAQRVAERARLALLSQQRRRPLPTSSAGAAGYPDDAQSAAALFRQADVALYAAKWSGGNQVAQRSETGPRNGLPETADDVPEQRGTGAAPLPQRRLRLLLVDDDPGLRLLLRTTAETAEIEVDEAEDAQKAQRQIESKRPDVVILDVEMPGVDGLSFCRALREDPATRDLGILVLSGADIGHADAAAAAGADAFLRKPFSPFALLSVVERVAAGARGAAGSSIVRTPQEQLLLYAGDIRQLLEAERRQRELLQATYHETVTALVSALDSKDTGTGAHSQRVQQYALELARAVEPALLDDPSVEHGFLLHDIGKIGIPERILQKRGKLSSAEQRVMKMHAVLGAQMLSAVPLLQGEGLEVVRRHHERWDGGGYPDGLASDEIPLGARIFAVADALDAITSDRPYRRAATWATAKVEILRNSAGQFDPAVVARLPRAEPQLRRIHAQLQPV
jgi:cyclic di-GMP phosphodiesterase